MYQIDVMSKMPVYEQIVNQTEKFILMGALEPGSKLMSVRNMSVELSVNPNTIQKAIAELERLGLVQTVPGKGCYICEGVKTVLLEKGLNSLEGLREEIHRIKMAGVSKESIIKLIEEVYVDD